jgi:hypothetical protein
VVYANGLTQVKLPLGSDLSADPVFAGPPSTTQPETVRDRDGQGTFRALALQRVLSTTNEQVFIVFWVPLADVTKAGPRPSVQVGGVPAEPPALRDGLERAYRDLAVLTEQRDEKIRLVDEANKVRRWTWR